ncbi:MAG: archease [Flavobacteriaceae bacterium]|nr:MAG: archease [Flavobacteriaceae bacterium]
MNHFVKHTADVEIEVSGCTLQELFTKSLDAMCDILKEGGCKTITHFDCSIRVAISANDCTSLLIDFLSEVLSLSNIQKSLFCNVYFSELTENKLEAQLFGIWFDHFDREIKGVTYHEARVKKNDENNWETHIIFDI